MSKRHITRESVNRVLRAYWTEYKRYPWASILGFFLPAIGTIFVLFVPPLILAKLINIFISSGSVTFKGTMGLIVLYGVLWLLGEICWRVGMHFMNKVKASGMNSLSKIAYGWLAERDYAFYADNFVGSVTHKANSFVGSFEAFTTILNFNVVINVFPIIFAIIILGRYSLWLPLILLIAIALVIVISLPIIRRRAKYVVERHEARSVMSGRLSDMATNMITIKSFAKESQEGKTYGAYVNDYTYKWRAAADYQNLRLDTVLSPIYVITNIIGLVSAIFFANKLGLQAGAILVVFSYYAQVTRIFWEINNVYRGIESSITEAAEFTQLLIDPLAVQDKSNTHIELSDTTVEFDHVHFDYGVGEGASFLSDLNLSIPANQKVGLVGPSGGGQDNYHKTSLAIH
jgi:ATP-binding cassette subfamily B protein